MRKQDSFFELPAVKGIQAGMPYYSVMCPLDIVTKLFSYNDSSLSPDMRAQRILNKQRIPEMKEYILSNKNCYVFSALTASIDGDLEFVANKNSSSGYLKIAMNSRIIINDGQHRRAAIEAALQECPELRHEDISIVLYYDLGLKRSQQMFTDLNRYAARPTMSLNILYDNRDEFSVLIKECINEIPMFFGNVENEKSTISNRSKALFTLSAIFHASRDLIKGAPINDDETKKTIVSFWDAVSHNMLPWVSVKSKTISPVEFRRDYICAHAITLRALGGLGNALNNERNASDNWNDKLTFLQNINWSKNSKELQGLVMVNGRISCSRNNQKAFTEYLIEKARLENMSGTVTI
ncbi:DNA sulfur modification protein DndB [Desulfitobacterium metallireducens]|uniref:DNA sulfur modification protein DndB n=1 Tax=Desulfitobacterium metallireducens DSM 15288 TaxID=871968 RepID=W0E5B1_9FIRM|nr:DNA sulfur modification protein DndB [Desulfitobacterium metallireducens]AHF06060.1 DNA sulfur modification protein DndB [Desulfitobacterium metallireducens DSM 15288]